MSARSVVLTALLLTVVLAGERIFSKRPRRRRSAGPVALALGMVFSSVLDPARKASVEEIQRRKETGERGAESGEV